MLNSPTPATSKRRRLTIEPLAAALLLAPVPCLAHAHLQSASPAAGGETATPPTEVVLHFSEGVEPAFSKIEVKDQAGTRVDEGAAHTAPNDPAQFAIDLKKLAPGTYTVSWHATALDTHKTHGAFTFVVKP